MIRGVLDVLDHALTDAFPLSFYREALAFCSSFVDAHHHALEERYVFPLAVGADEVVAELRADHREGRVLLARVREGVHEEDLDRVVDEFTEYTDLLRVQLGVEERELWPRLDRLPAAWPLRPDLGALAARVAEWGSTHTM